jgi:acyl carrier protein
VTPRSAAERALCVVWAEILGLDEPGVEDDFFELGGDSISAVQLITRLQRWLDAGVPLVALFETPTIAGLARHLEQHFADALAAALLRAAPATARTPEQATHPARTPLTFSQQSLWFLHTLYPGDTSASEQFAIRLRGPLDRVALERAWRSVLRRHPVLTAIFLVEGEQVWQVAGSAAEEMRHVPISDEVQLIGIAESALREPFDLTQGPLVRAVLCRLSADSHVLLVTAHHIVADGLSVPVLQADLARLYTSGTGADAASGTPYTELASRPAW